MSGPGGVAVPVATYRSSARYDLDSGRAGRAVATFEATTAGPYRVSAVRDNHKTWVDIERQGQPSKWVTLRACTVLRAAFG